MTADKKDAANARDVEASTPANQGGTAAWGPPLWQSMHFIAMCYPGPDTEKIVVAYEAFYTSLATVLPCKVCASHYSGELKRLPVRKHMGSREELFAWTVEVHNRVNERLGKPRWGLSDALKHYTEMVAPTTTRGIYGREAWTKGAIGAHLALVVAGVVAVIATSTVLYVVMRRPPKTG